MFLALSLIFVSSLVNAQDSAAVHPYLTDKYFIDAGWFHPNRVVKMGADGSIGPNLASIDFSEEFRLSKADDTFDIDFGWKFGKKWMLLGQYFESNSGSEWTLDEDLEWNDVVFQAGTGVAVGTEFSVTRIFFGRSFGSSDVYDFGIGGGFHWLKIGGFIEGTINIDGIGNTARREAVHAKGPLPNVGVWYWYSMSPKWAFRTRFDWLDASIGDYQGSLINFSIGFNYAITRHFGVGLNYNNFTLRAKVHNANWQGRVSTSYKGPFVFLSAYW